MVNMLIRCGVLVRSRRQSHVLFLHHEERSPVEEGGDDALKEGEEHY